MMDEIIIKSEIKRGGNFFILLIGGFGACAISFYLISNSLKDAYPEIFGVGLGVIFGVFGLFSLFAIMVVGRLEIYHDRLEIKSMFGYTRRIIYLKDILNWTEVERKTKNEEYTELTLFTEAGTCTLSSSLYNNYALMRAKLIAGRRHAPVPSEKPNPINKRGWALVVLVLGALCLYGAYSFYAKGNRELSASELTTLTQVVTSPIEIHKGSKGSRSIKLNLKDYPEFDFNISGVGYSATSADYFVSNVRTGDTLYVDIKTNEYQMKLTKEKELGFWDKYVNYKFISVCGLRDKANIYLSLPDYNKADNSNSNLGFWIMGLLVLFIIGAGLRMLV